MNTKEQFTSLVIQRIRLFMRVDQILFDLEDKFAADDPKIESWIEVATVAMGKLEQALDEIDTAIDLLNEKEAV